ncbi:type VII secretion target [Nocardia stercoris]|uniref:ESX-1 secretion-associated protein n=1 Tax=Nocardia stercoris TaxID=2483361 RepID=A0A3M2L0Z5_9NOCA|nr:type VII secretion target [Nocardia stercoris]RMI30626.1 ESX-1 secretion-associated protein [Nocardia stercoris]
MVDLNLDISEVQKFAVTHEDVATAVKQAGQFNTGQNVAAMTPVFGLIGADYLALYAVAEAAHGTDIQNLGSKVSDLAQATFNTVAALQGTDTEFGAAVNAQTAQLEA